MQSSAELRGSFLHSDDNPIVQYVLMLSSFEWPKFKVDNRKERRSHSNNIMLKSKFQRKNSIRLQHIQWIGEVGWMCYQ